MGPFGTYDALPLPSRLIYWLAVVSLNWLLCDLAVRYVDTLLSNRRPRRPLLVPLGGSLLVSLPATGVVHMAGSVAGLSRDGTLVVLYGKVLLLCAVISVMAYKLIRRGSDEVTEAQSEAAESPLSARSPVEDDRKENSARWLFFNRLSKPLQGELLCLEMQDHYLAVHTSEGSELILCRMEDAARELDGLGQRVHRSWWVASAALAGTERHGQQQRLRLTDGRLVPVGRTYRKRLKERGFL